ncbi:hypothetical protein NDU88_006076 [Pleurodeles waltl]|uniref:Uncharacterized protein n=1 Tax=Pleurodeles waltl TaxID=8319 RepID=A0AAV7TX87_PLEWA|nr:hypothetical protein NDU88_006076 [Pleurodeles waltl]
MCLWRGRCGGVLDALEFSLKLGCGPYVDGVAVGVDFGVFPYIWQGCGLEGTVDDGLELGSDDLASLVEDKVGAGVCWAVRVDGAHGFAGFFIVSGGPGVQPDGAAGCCVSGGGSR